MRPAWTEKLDALAERLFLRQDHWPANKIVHDSIWGTQAFEGWESAIMDLPLLQRLRSIHQTSLAYLTFPTALHTRFDHSLGVTSGTKLLASQVLDLEKDDPAYAELSAAALLHDIGHGPFSANAHCPFSFGSYVGSGDLKTPVKHFLAYAEALSDVLCGKGAACGGESDLWRDQEGASQPRSFGFVGRIPGSRSCYVVPGGRRLVE